MKYILITILLLGITGCYDPLLKIKLKNNAGENMCIEQYTAPHFFCKEIKKSKNEIFYLHSEFTIIKKDKVYIYDILNAIANSNTNIYNNNLITKGIIRVQLNHDMLIYVLPKEYNQNVSLFKNQPVNFPIVPKVQSLQERHILQRVPEDILIQRKK